MKINIKQMALAGMMLALLTISKYLDIVMIKTPLGYSWIEFYMVLVVVFVLVLPMPITTIILITAPFIWFALGQTSQQSPFGFFLDYCFPLLVMLIIYFARFFKNKILKSFSIIFLIILAFLIKWLSHSLSGLIAWETPFWPSATANAPMVFVTMVLVIGIIIPFMPRLNELQNLVNKKGMTW